MKLLSSLSMKAKIIAGAATTAAVAGTVALVLVLSSPDAFRLLKVFEMIGKSTVTRVNSGAMDAYEGMNLESGDVIAVGETSTMTLSLDSDKYLSLDPNTVLELIAEGTETDSKTTVNLRSGGVLNEITEPLSAESSYSVNTPKATMAVRGTSFYVSVRALDDGSYITDISVFHGKVEVQLLDEEGNPRGAPVIVEPNESVAILTVPVEGNTTGAEINGTSCFILRKSDGSDVFSIVGEGEDPVMPLNALILPRSVIERVLNTHDNTEIVLSEAVLRELLGDETFAKGDEDIKSVSADETTAETTTVTETNTITDSEAVTTTVPVTEEPAEETSVVTTAPEREDATVTTVAVVTTVTEKEIETTEFEIVEETFEESRVDTVADTTRATTPFFYVNPGVIFTPAGTMPETTAVTTVPEIMTTVTTVPVVTTTAETTTVEETTTEATTTTTEATTTTPEETTTEEETTTTEEAPVYYTVSFVSNPDGQQVAEAQTVEEGGYAETPACVDSIEYNGATYIFWEIETELGPITADTEISVRYVPESSVFTVVVTDNGSNVLSGKYLSGESITLPSAVGAAGLIFEYWGLMGANSGGVISERGQYAEGASLTVDQSNAYNYEDEADRNIRVEAVYAQVIAVTFLDYDGTTITTIDGMSGGNMTLPAEPVREGYTFDGWFNADGTEFTGAIAADTADDFSVTAKYTGNPVTISLVYDGTTYSTESGVVGETYTVPAFDATAAGIEDGAVYTFNHYTDGEGTEYAVGAQIELTGNLTLTADVTVTSWPVAVTFLDYDGTTITTIDGMSGGNVTLPAEPVREGYTFDGWFNADGTEFTGAIAADTADDFSVTAKYTGNPVTISLVYDGTTYSTESGVVGETYTVPAFDATAAGIEDGAVYTFNHYTDGEGTEYAVGAQIELTGNLTLTADVTVTSWPVAVTFLDYDGTTITTIDGMSGGNVTLPAEPEREGYTFDGWFNADGTEFTGAIAADTTDDFSVTAEYTGVTVSVIFYDYQGNEYTTVEGNYGSTITLPDAPERSGYSFDGWFIAEDVQFTGLIDQTEEIHVIAMYSLTGNIVTFVSNPGGVVVAEEQIVEDGEYAVEPECDETIYVDGIQYIFWEVEDALGPITGDTEISVKYVEAGSVFSVEVTDNGTSVVSGTYFNGDTITLPTASSPDGATFKYWGLMGANSGGVESVRGQYAEGDTVTVDDSKVYYYESGTDTNIRFEAFYSYPVTVTFLDYDGTTLATVTGNSGESITLPDDPSREGYTFQGWYSVDTSESFSGSIPSDRTTDFSVKAEYTGNPATITYVYNGTTYDTVTVYVGNSYILPGFDATAAGIADGTSYVLNGYYEDGEYVGTIGDSVIITGDMTLTANITLT